MLDLRRSTARHWVVWCMLIALPCYGLSATMTEMLGSSHKHRTTAATANVMQGWVDFRRSHHLANRMVPHQHSHSMFERHHHDASDETVIALEGTPPNSAAGNDGATPSGSAALVLALASTVRIPPVSWISVAWRTPSATPFASRHGGRLERPPRA